MESTEWVSCRGCGTAIAGRYDEYARCPDCGSYNYVSRRSAEEENNEYFNVVLKECEEAQIDIIKKTIHGLFRKIDLLIRIKEYIAKKLIHRKQQAYLSKSRRLLEIGFGAGRNLYSLLKQGFDAHGIDISESAVSNFQKNHPEFKDRVFKSSTYHGRADTVYCNALLEHLDQTQEWLGNISKIVNSDGIIIIEGVPILSNRASDFTIRTDINFWKPVHRIIFTLSGIQSLAKNSGHRIVQYGYSDDFNYRLMNLFLKKGIDKIMYYRNPAVVANEMPTIWQYFLLCIKALFVKSLTLSGFFVLKKSD